MTQGPPKTWYDLLQAKVQKFWSYPFFIFSGLFHGIIKGDSGQDYVCKWRTDWLLNLYIWDYTTHSIDDCIKPKSNEDFMECLVGFCMCFLRGSVKDLFCQISLKSADISEVLLFSLLFDSFLSGPQGIETRRCRHWKSSFSGSIVEPWMLVATLGGKCASDLQHLDQPVFLRGKIGGPLFCLRCH